MRTKKGFLLPVLVLAALATARGAYADLSEADRAMGKAWFERGYAARVVGHNAEARADFERSYEVDHRPGALLNVAACDKDLRHMATAWRELLRGAAESRKVGHDDWADDAAAEAARIEPTLPRLILHIDHVSDSDDRRITLDGVALPEPMIDTPMPVDAGNHRVEAAAPGKRTWATTFEARDEAISIVTVPVLEAEIAIPVDVHLAAPEAPVAPASGSRGSWELALGVVGGASVLAATALTVSAYTTYQGAGCTTVCTTSGHAIQERARFQGNLATAFALAGGGALVGAALLWFLDPIRVAHFEAKAALGPMAAGVSIERSW